MQLDHDPAVAAGEAAVALRLKDRRLPRAGQIAVGPVALRDQERLGCLDVVFADDDVEIVELTRGDAAVRGLSQEWSLERDGDDAPRLEDTQEPEKFRCQVQIPMCVGLE